MVARTEERQPDPAGGGPPYHVYEVHKHVSGCLVEQVIDVFFPERVSEPFFEQIEGLVLYQREHHLNSGAGALQENKELTVELTAVLGDQARTIALNPFLLGLEWLVLFV